MRLWWSPPGSRTSFRTFARASEETLRPPLPIHVNRLTSASNPYVRHVAKLRVQRSHREALGATVLVGSAPVEEFASHLARSDRESEARGFPGSIRTLFCLENAPDGIHAHARVLAERVVMVSAAVMDRMAGVVSSNGVLALAEVDVPKLDRWETNATKRILALDRVQDPGNVGTLVRTASAMGWDGAFLVDGCADVFGDKAMRASRGASLRLPTRRGKFEELLELVEALDMDAFAADAAPDADAEARLSRRRSSRTSRPLCLLLGSEGGGVREEAWRRFSPVRIPMPGLEESLNVAVAGGILMHRLTGTQLEPT
eukprot:jgi/Pico_ML_1/52459/g3161.t1